MTTSTSILPTAWQQWLRDNLARGCIASDLERAMIEAGWDAELARRAIREAAAAQPGTATTATMTSAAAPGSARTPRIALQSHWLQAHDRTVRLRLCLDDPVVAVFDEFLDAQECETLIARSRQKLKRSAIVDPASGRDAVIEARSSEGTYFALAEDEFIARIDARIAALMNWPQENGEGIQILRYGVGGEYRAHWDYFSPDDPGSAVHLARGGQRVSTLVMYLNDVAEGGGTHFPDLGLTISPKQGAALYFEYCDAQGRLEPRSLHAGLPVLAGEKWIATKWMRQRRYA
ncbi:MAG: 2OG-Fe(II) oxygenase [Rhodoferax sp.]